MATRRAAALPLVEPILLTPRADPFDDPAWLFEPKFDGYRGLLYVTKQGCYFRSKRSNVLKRFEQLCYWVREELPVKEAILDGEVIALDSEGRPSFRDLVASRGTSITRPLTVSGCEEGTSAACRLPGVSAP